MDKKEKLEELKKEALVDASLPLRSGATNLVFGVGNPEAEILFIGEGPGYWEDVKAEPFVGNAGLLLNQLLRSINIPREEVYITNVIMHRAPQNRDPEAGEIAAYQKYLDGIINIISPKMIATLGRFSMAKFLPGVLISSIHGKPRLVEWQERTLTVVPMYHPAAALRSGDVMFKIKNDFLEIPRILENIRNKKNDSIKQKKEVSQMELL